MIKPGTILTLRYGTRIQIDSFLGAGGEGIAHHAYDMKTRRPGVYKVLKNSSPAKVLRTQFLVDQKLNEMGEQFCAPIDYYDNGHLGHFSPRAPGVSLEQYLQTPGGLYAETYKLCIDYCHGHALLNQRGIAEGDPSLTNATVCAAPTGAELYLYDFDNFSAPGTPPPTAFGQEDRMAPELRRALKGGRPALPDELSDRYAIATVIHEMVLAKSVASGFDRTPEEFDGAMAGGWPHDPLYGSRSVDSGGYPSTILNAELARMLRRGLSGDRDERPSAEALTQVLSDNFGRIWMDPRCQSPSFIDPSKTHCPVCGQPFPPCKLVFPTLHKVLVCESAALAIGRADLLSPTVSSLHAVVRKYGQVTILQSQGWNGTFRQQGDQWVRLEGEVILQNHDRLRFADVECVVEEII